MNLQQCGRIAKHDLLWSLLVAASMGVFSADAHGLQERAAVQVIRVSPDTVELGDSFMLRVSVYVPAGRELRVPATLLPEWGVESLRRVRTEVVEAADGSLQVALEYDLIPFEIGLAATPQLEMATGAAEPEADRVRVEDRPEWIGGLIGVDGRPRDRLVVAGRRVFVTSPVLLDDIAQGMEPRPPADVVGSSWNVPVVLGASLLSLLLLGVVTVQAREWLAVRAAAAVQVDARPETPEMWRERALGRLDRIRARGHHRTGRLRDFYEGTGDVVREYLACFDPAWTRSRTTTELMRDLSAAPGWPDPEALARAMRRGEVAKFAAAAARERAAATAEGDWRTMRAWIDASGEAPAFARMREATADDDPADSGDGARESEVDAGTDRATGEPDAAGGPE